MRHTLLPYPARRALRKEYRIRALVVLCFMLSCAGVIGIGSLFPGFIHAISEERSQINTIASLQEGKKDSGILEIEKELAEDATLLSALLSLTPHDDMSKRIAKIAEIRGVVDITSISMERSGTTSVAYIIQGLAPTRDSLLSFKTRLEQLVPGGTVELPISELAKSTDVQFSLAYREP